tara:strand:- start:381 stop:683 length:303 start_codon:yes stop_codon:yes gene_type:complete
MVSHQYDQQCIEQLVCEREGLFKLYHVPPEPAANSHPVSPQFQDWQFVTQSCSIVHVLPVPTCSIQAELFGPVTTPLGPQAQDTQDAVQAVCACHGYDML